VVQGATVVMSSHELDRAEALADRVVTLDGGVTAVGDGASRRTEAGRRVAEATPEPAPHVAPQATPEVTHVA
jgi:ABC-type multidrug transport system ATPase subunit